MRALFTIKHPDVPLVGSPAARFIDQLNRTCGNAIDDHAYALSQTLAFRDAIADVQASIVFAFRPTLSAVAICSRPSPTQFDVHLESSRADICSVSEAIASRIAAALPVGEISYEVTLLEADGRETGIRGSSVTFMSLFIDQAKEFKFIPVASAVLGGLIATSLITRNAAASFASTGLGFFVLAIYVAASSFFRSRSHTRPIVWKFESSVPL